MDGIGLEWSEVLEEEGIQVTEDVQRVRDRDGGGGEEEGAAGGVGESQEARGSRNSSRGTRRQQVNNARPYKVKFSVGKGNVQIWSI